MEEILLTEARVGVVPPPQRSPEEPRRQTRQTARLGREIAERYRPTACRHAHVVGKMTLHGIVETDEALLDHVREQRGGEDLRHRADFEDAVGADRRRFGRAQTTAPERPPLSLPEDPNGNANVLARVPAEDPAHRVRDKGGAVDLVCAGLVSDRARVAQFIRAERTQENPSLPPLHELAIPLDDQRDEKLDPHPADYPPRATSFSRDPQCASTASYAAAGVDPQPDGRLS
jgi:hypothetical protein